MTYFGLDPRLARDSFILGEMDNCLLLLVNNKLAPWFVLVPKVTGISELYELDTDAQLLLLNQINRLSRFIKEQFVADKLNVAAIGNIVKQLHVHVIARTENDQCWPGVVWGMDVNETYTNDEVTNLEKLLLTKLEGFSSLQGQTDT